MKLRISLQVKSLSEVLRPARERGTELEQAITSMFAVMNAYTGDRAKLTLQGAELPLPRRLFVVRDPLGREVAGGRTRQGAERRRLHC